MVQHYDLNTVVLRPPNLYGQYGKNYPEFGFINYFIELAAILHEGGPRNKYFELYSIR